MGTVDLPNTRTPGEVTQSQDYNDLRNALIGDFVGRNNPSGIVEDCQRLGTATVPWGEVHSKAYYLNGTLLDFSTFTGDNYKIDSGRTRTTSILPDFIRADGVSPSFTLLATDTPLTVTINGSTTTYTADQVEAGLITAPTINNTAQVNDANLIGDYDSTLQGENFTEINLDNIGSEITSRVGQFIVLKNGTEYMIGTFGDNQLYNVYRGFFLDSSGLPIERQPLSDDDILELMSTAWIFVEDDASTIDVTYNSPIFSETVPSSPVVGDYWYDQNVQQWKRYDGATFVIINRTLVGIAVIDNTNCVASRSFNFFKNYNGFQEFFISFNESSPFSLRMSASVPNIDVYGETVKLDWTSINWTIPTNLEAGQIEQADTYYYAYLTELGKPILSDIAPYDFRPEIGQFLHPYNSWRFLARIYNNAASDFDIDTLRQQNVSDRFALVRTDQDGRLPPVDASRIVNQGLANIVVFNTAGAHVYNVTPYVKKIVVEIWGGGAGSLRFGASNTSGGTTSFDVLMSATGGVGTNFNRAGGVGIGGNLLNLSGSPGANGSGTDNWAPGISAPRGGAGNTNVWPQPTVSYGGAAGLPLASGVNLSVIMGSGGYAQSIYFDPLPTYNITVGAAGVKDSAATGIDGQTGLVVIWEYY
jgi:hypothetical protein